MLTLLELLIGLALSYLLVAIVASYVVEFIASYLNLRAKGLERFIAQSFGEDVHIENTKWARAFYQHPIIQGLFTPTALTGSEGTSPSYIPPATFSTALLDLVRSQATVIADGQRLQLKDIQQILADGKLPDGLKSVLQAALSKGAYEMKAVQQDIENWFDANMQRASGWYKRFTQLWLFVVALGLSAAFNLDSFYLASRLMQEPELAKAFADTAQSINPGDGSKKLGDLELGIRQLLANDNNDRRISLQAEGIATLEQRTLVIGLLAANQINRVDAATAQRLLEQASAKPFVDYPEAFGRLLLKTPGCTANRKSAIPKDFETQKDFERDLDMWLQVLECKIADTQGDRDKTKAIETEIEHFFNGVASNPQKTIDPKLGDLGLRYLFSKTPANELKPLTDYLNERIKSMDGLRNKLASLHAKLPEIRWICDVVREHGWGFKDYVAALIGWLTTAFLASLGAPFWFELVGRLVNLRGVGTKPALGGGSDVRK
jgi:hypothetical protein